MVENVNIVSEKYKSEKKNNFKDFSSLKAAI